jgi:hypothetical protein
MKEPSGLLRSDGKRPDDLILTSWQSGKSLTCDVYSHSRQRSADSYQLLQRHGASELAAFCQQEKYANIFIAYIFQPLAFETFGLTNLNRSLFSC